MKILIVILMFFTISALLIISNNNLALHDEKNLKNFSRLYLDWMEQIYSNAQIITEDVIKLDWIPNISP